jgi:hypothetical protein
MSIISMLMIGGSSNPTNGPLLYANLTSNTETYTFSPDKVPGYIAGNTTATLTISDNIYLYSNSISTPALTVSGWNANDTIYVINKGYIMGRGGDGGAYGGELGTVAATNGGTAISLSANTTIFNYNFIAGGGGGGAAANRSTSGSGGGGAGGGYGGSTYGGSLGSGSSTSATLNFGSIATGAFESNPTGDIIVRSVGYDATTFGIANNGKANNAFISVFGTKITCPDRTGLHKFNPPVIGNVGDIPLSSRGINVVVLNPQNSAVESAVCYDTWPNRTGDLNDSNALLIALQNLPTGRIVLMEVLDAATMTLAVRDYLTSNFGAPATNPSTWTSQRRAFVFMGIKGADPNSSLFVVTGEGTNAMITATASFTGGSSTGSVAAGGAGGAIGLSGSSGSIATSATGSQYGSGGGGGRIPNGTGGQGGIPGVDVRGLGGGTGGGGGGASGLPAQAKGGQGGTLDAVGSNGTAVATTDGGGGGGGWGASGGIGSITPAVDVVSVGLGGKAIEKNGKQLIIAAPGTLYGAVV